MSVKVKPSEQVKGGGMDGPHIIVKSRYENFDYLDKEQTSQGTGVGLMLRCKNESGDGREQFYRASDESRFVPSDDGLALEPAAGHGTGNLTDSSRCAVFMVELDNAGFNVEESDINDDISILEGAIFDFTGKPLPIVSGGERIVPMPSKLLALPDEKNDWRKKFAKKSTGAGSSRRAARGSAAGGSRRRKGGSRRGGQDGEDVGVDDAAHGYMLEMLKEYEEVGRDELADIILKKARRDDNRKEIVARVYEEDFLEGYPDDWEYADETIFALEGE